MVRRIFGLNKKLLKKTGEDKSESNVDQKTGSPKSVKEPDASPNENDPQRPASAYMMPHHQGRRPLLVRRPSSPEVDILVALDLHLPPVISHMVRKSIATFQVLHSKTWESR